MYNVVMNWSRIFKYHLRWQSGFIYTWPVMYLLNDVLQLPLWLTILTFQFVGALLYYPIDNIIFKPKS